MEFLETDLAPPPGSKGRHRSKGCKKPFAIFSALVMLHLAVIAWGVSEIIAQ